MQSGSAEDREHGRYSPSQADRFFACPGSVKAQDRAPARPPSPYAEEGTKGHDVLHEALKNRIRSAKEAKEDYSYVCMEDFSDDFYYSVQTTLDYVYDILDKYPDAEMWLETKVEVPCDKAPGDADGHADVIIWVPSIRTLYVIDFKHGSGVVKEAEENRQGLQYAAGVLYGSELVPPDAVDNVVIVIAQPRAFHPDGSIREWTTTPYRVFEYLIDLENAVVACEADDAPLIPGETQCMFCDCKTICPAREATALRNAIGTQFASIRDVVNQKLPDVEGLDIERVSHILSWKPFLEKWMGDVEKHAKELMISGVDVPGHKLVEAPAKRSWYGDEKTLAVKLAALARRDITEVMRVKLITITDAERMVVDAFKQGVDKDRKKQAAEDAKAAFALLTDKKSSGSISIASVDDPRPAVNRAAMAFGSVTGLIEPPPTEIE